MKLSPDQIVEAAAESFRPARVGTRIAHALGELIQREFIDARLGLITIIEVKMSSDLLRARIMVSHVDPSVDAEAVLLELRHNVRRLRRGLARRVRLRAVPRLDFRWDDRSDYLQRLQTLIAQGLESTGKGIK